MIEVIHRVWILMDNLYLDYKLRDWKTYDLIVLEVCSKLEIFDGLNQSVQQKHGGLDHLKLIEKFGFNFERCYAKGLEFHFKWRKLPSRSSIR